MVNLTLYTPSGIDYQISRNSIGKSANLCPANPLGLRLESGSSICKSANLCLREPSGIEIRIPGNSICKSAKVGESYLRKRMVVEVGKICLQEA